MGINLLGRIHPSGVRISVDSAFDPEAFWSGFSGGLWNFTNGSYLFSDVGMTTPAAIDGNVNAVTDLSGNDLHLTSSFAYPFTRKSGYCLSDQGGAMITTAISMGVYTSFALFQTSTLGTLQNIVDSDYGSSNRVSQNILLHTSGNLQTYIFGYLSPSIIMPSPTLSTTTNYYSSVAVNNASADLRIDGVVYNTGAGGTLAGGLAPVAIGASFGGTLVPQHQDFLGRLYCAGWIGKKCTQEEVEEVGNYMLQISGQTATI